MSVNLMAAIFQTEFRDLQDNEGNVTKASTAKLVLLAMADNANDDGEGIYPSIDSLKKKCALSDQTVRNTFDALLHNGIINRVGMSKYGTYNHSINTSCFPRAENKRDFPKLLAGVKPVEGQMSTDLGSNEYRLGVKPVDPNHQLTTKEPSPDIVDALVQQAITDREREEAYIAFESGLGFGKLPWDSKPEWKRLGKFVREIYAKDRTAFDRYATWRKTTGKFGLAFSNPKIRQFPDMFIDTGWPTYLAHSAMNGTEEKTRLL